MNNNQAWEQEYKKPQFLTMGTEPLSDVKEFMRWLKKQARKNPQDFSAPFTEWTVLDLGCGNGKNLKYIVENYTQSGIGYDISPTAISAAKKLGDELLLVYEVRSIGKDFPLESNSIDLALDVTSSNALNQEERGKFLSEISRVLKPSAFFFIRALCKEGDTNAKTLIKDFPGPEYDTYVLGDTGITERVFSKEDFLSVYEPYLKIIHLEKTTGYQKWGNQSYKRNYWIAYATTK